MGVSQEVGRRVEAIGAQPSLLFSPILERMRPLVGRGFAMTTLFFPCLERMRKPRLPLHHQSVVFLSSENKTCRNVSGISLRKPSPHIGVPLSGGRKYGGGEWLQKGAPCVAQVFRSFFIHSCCIDYNWAKLRKKTECAISAATEIPDHISSRKRSEMVGNQ